MNRESVDNNPVENPLSVSGWHKEAQAGREVAFLCIYYERFGFGMSVEQVKEAVGKLDALLLRGEATAAGGEVQVDRSGMSDALVMIAFRPAENHASRYFDFPEDAARDLLAKLQERLETTGAGGEAAC